jgi:hypothetical protein
MLLHSHIPPPASTITVASGAAALKERFATAPTVEASLGSQGLTPKSER